MQKLEIWSTFDIIKLQKLKRIQRLNFFKGLKNGPDSRRVDPGTSVYLLLFLLDIFFFIYHWKLKCALMTVVSFLTTSEVCKSENMVIKLARFLHFPKTEYPPIAPSC